MTKTVRIVIRLPPEYRDAIVAAAEAQQRSANSWCAETLIRRLVAENLVHPQTAPRKR